MDSGGYIRSLEAPGKTRLLLRLSRREPNSVQHGPRPAPEPFTGRQAAKLFRLSVCGSRGAGISERVAGILVRRHRVGSRHAIAGIPGYRVVTISPGPPEGWGISGGGTGGSGEAPFAGLGTSCESSPGRRRVGAFAGRTSG